MKIVLAELSGLNRKELSEGTEVGNFNEDQLSKDKNLLKPVYTISVFCEFVHKNFLLFSPPFFIFKGQESFKSE